MRFGRGLGAFKVDSGTSWEVDWNSPLTQGLQALWVFDGGVIIELLRQRISTVTTIKTGVATVGGGLAGRGNAQRAAKYTSQGAGPTISNNRLRIKDRMTVAAFVRSTATSKAAFGRPASNIHTTPFFDFCIFTDGNFRMSAGGSSVIPSCGVTLNDSRWHMAAITYDGATARSYCDFNAPGTASISGDVRDGSQNFIFGGSRSGSEDFAGDQLWNAIWNRPLSRQEICRLTYEPLAMLKPPNEIIGIASAATKIPVFMHHYQQQKQAG